MESVILCREIQSFKKNKNSQNHYPPDKKMADGDNTIPITQNWFTLNSSSISELDQRKIEMKADFDLRKRREELEKLKARVAQSKGINTLASSGSSNNTSASASANANSYNSSTGTGPSISNSSYFSPPNHFVYSPLPTNTNTNERDYSQPYPHLPRTQQPVQPQQPPLVQAQPYPPQQFATAISNTNFVSSPPSNTLSGSSNIPNASGNGIPLQDSRRFSSTHLPPPLPEMFAPPPPPAAAAAVHSYSSYPSVSKSSRVEPVNQFLQSFDDRRKPISTTKSPKFSKFEEGKKQKKRGKPKKEPKDIFKQLLGLRWDLIIQQFAEVCHQRQR